MKEYFEIGQIVNTSGLKGFIKVKPFNHQLKGAELALSTFGVGKGGDANSPLHSGFALLMEM